MTVLLDVKAFFVVHVLSNEFLFCGNKRQLFTTWRIVSAPKSRTRSTPNVKFWPAMDSVDPVSLQQAVSLQGSLLFD